jgi:hypothetical protein
VKPDIRFMFKNFVPCRKQRVSNTTINRLILFLQTIALYSQNDMKNIITLYGLNADFLNIITDGMSKCDSSTDIATGYGSGFDSRQGQDFSLVHNVQTGSGPTQPPGRWVPRALSQGVKRQGREADHSPPTSAEIENGGAIRSLLHTSSWSGAQLIKHKDNFTLQMVAGVTT